MMLIIFSLCSSQERERDFKHSYWASLPLLVVTLLELKKAKKQANSADNEQELPSRMVYTMEELDSSQLMYSAMK